MEVTHVTYKGKLKGLYNVLEQRKFDIRYSVDIESGKTTEISIMINPATMEMITFNYQELKKVVEEWTH